MSAKIEIEKKYTVKDTEFLLKKYESEKIIQGYLSTDPERTVRVRVKGNRGFITIKGKSFSDGSSRFEWEKEIDVNEVLALLPLCLPGVINKTRYLVPYKNQLFEVDVFHDDNQGLVIAELELLSEQQKIDLPDWIDQDVTNDVRFYNAYIVNNPFKNWK